MIAAFFHLSFLTARSPMPAFHWMPSPLKRKKFGAFTARGRVPRAGGAVDERLGRVLLGVVRDRDGLVARERPDHHVRVELLHQPLRLLERRGRRVVRAADADELEWMAADRAAVSSPRTACSCSSASPRQTRRIAVIAPPMSCS